MAPASILIIEDEAALATALARVCQRLGWRAELRASGHAGLDALAAGKFDLAILDIGLPDLSGLDVLEKARARSPQLPVVIITAHGKLENAVAARKLGAAAYLVKPLDLREIERTLTQILDTASAPASPALSQATGAQLLGTSPAMQRVFLEIAHACTTDAPVLLSGPTGTGKTLAARTIHSHSTRKDAPFVTLHCGALQEQLLESELFGHERGAFTGAVTERAGHIERAPQISSAPHHARSPSHPRRSPFSNATTGRAISANSATSSNTPPPSAPAPSSSPRISRAISVSTPGRRLLPTQSSPQSSPTGSTCVSQKNPPGAKCTTRSKTRRCATCSRASTANPPSSPARRK